MNKHNDTTQTPRPATKASPQIAIELERLAALSPKGAYTLEGAIDTLNRVITGLVYETVANDCHAGSILSEVAYFLAVLHARVVEVADDQTPEGVDEINWRFWTMLKYRTGVVYYLKDISDYGEDMIADIAVRAATAARDISKTKREAPGQAVADIAGES
ncbi:MAG TPA: hypothetical protein VGX71_07645 [Pseudaminobacter sp.]|nr:hypothetical protein [Pseudaminobacter sp.]